jgi:hypothetical protein
MKNCIITPSGVEIALPEIRESGSFLQTIYDDAQQARMRRVLKRTSNENPKGLCILVIEEGQNRRRVSEWMRACAVSANANLMILMAYPFGTGVIDGKVRKTGSFEVVYSIDLAAPEGAGVSIHPITEVSGL